MAFKVRSSKFRHLHGEVTHATYDDIKPFRKACEGPGIAGNEKRLALPWDSGQKLCVIENGKTGRFGVTNPMIMNHSPVLDHQFSPFNTEQVTTVAEDGVVRVYDIPEGGLTKNLEAEVELTGHIKAIQLLDYHPSVEGLLATASKDHSVRIWDLEEQAQISKFDLPEDCTSVQSLQWRYDGSLVGLACKDKMCRIFDPRQPAAVLEIQTTQSTRPIKFCWAGQDRFISTGFSPNMDREFSYWDIRKPESSLVHQNVDKASGVLMPFYDAAHGLLFLTARGDGNIRYYEIDDAESKVHFITDNRSTKSIKHFNFVTRRALDTTKCETQRALKVDGQSVHTMSFTVPRKSSDFQEDLFPDMISAEPALDLKDWCAGQNAPPKLESMRPGTHAPKKRKVTSKEEIKILKQRVSELEEENARLKAKLGVPAGGNSRSIGEASGNGMNLKRGDTGSMASQGSGYARQASGRINM